jgi:phage-related protein
MKVNLYDAGDPNADPPEPAKVLEVWSIDAKEAVANDPARYSLSPPADDAVPAVPLKGKKADKGSDGAGPSA